MNAEKLNVDEYLFFFYEPEGGYTVPDKPEVGYPKIYCA